MVESYIEVAIYFPYNCSFKSKTQLKKQVTNAFRVIEALEQFWKSGFKYTKS